LRFVKKAIGERPTIKKSWPVGEKKKEPRSKGGTLGRKKRGRREEMGKKVYRRDDRRGRPLRKYCRVSKGDLNYWKGKSPQTSTREKGGKAHLGEESFLRRREEREPRDETWVSSEKQLCRSSKNQRFRKGASATKRKATAGEDRRGEKRAGAREGRPSTSSKKKGQHLEKKSKARSTVDDKGTTYQ